MTCQVEKDLVAEAIEMLRQYAYLVELYWKEEKMSPSKADDAVSIADKFQEALDNKQ